MGKDTIFIKERWDIEYEHSAGDVGSRFLRALRDDEQILATVCPSCERVMTPPRGFCEKCFVKIEQWKTVGPGGTLDAFTIVYEPFEGLPEPPYAFGYVKLDGADTAIANFIRGVDLSDPDAAAAKLMGEPRVRSVFEGKRHGLITDFHFELA